MSFCAIIPARGGSKGIPRKNIYPLLGKPLLAYTIEAALNSKHLDRVFVSSEDSEILSIASEIGAECILRPSSLSSDYSTTHDVLKHAQEYLLDQNYVPSAYVTLQPTSPLRSTSHIDDSIDLFISDDCADSLVSCIEVPHIFNPVSVMRYDDSGYLIPYLNQPTLTRRQDKPFVLARNGAAIYITRSTNISKYVFGGRLLPYMMDAYSSLDIDTIDDLLYAEKCLVNALPSN